jgi:5'-phosphate synthase pdxT subunit
VSNRSLSIGVLALQGAFIEHARMLDKLSVHSVEIRRAEQLELVAGLIIPGGESTAMSLIARRWGLIEPLRAWVRDGKPIWGTCAGLIFLAEHVQGQKAGGQPLLGGLDISVNRNYFGRQIDSFQADIELTRSIHGTAPCAAIFIRAPVITSIGPVVESLATLTTIDEHTLIVAVRQANILATAFHPELSQDTRWHLLFTEMVRQANRHNP